MREDTLAKFDVENAGSLSCNLFAGFRFASECTLRTNCSQSKFVCVDTFIFQGHHTACAVANLQLGSPGSSKGLAFKDQQSERQHT